MVVPSAGDSETKMNDRTKHWAVVGGHGYGTWNKASGACGIRLICQENHVTNVFHEVVLRNLEQIAGKIL